MGIHDWTRVDAGIFHHFHVEWMSALARAFNQGLLPPDHYSLVEQYAAKAKSIVVRHTSDHRVIAVLEIVSPGNKSRQRRFEAFVSKAEKLLLAGIHLLVVDLFPPGPRDPQGIHGAIWERFTESDLRLARKARKLSSLRSWTSGGASDAR